MEDSDDHQSAATLIGSNEDLLTEILLWLPVFSILCFKSVSKHWRQLLSDSHFTHRYDIINSKSPGRFYGNIYLPFDVENRSPRPINNSLDFYFNRSNVTIEQSCNGLLLCYTFHDHGREYYVFNSTTKQLAIIPPLLENIWTMALAFHQTECVHYKVVCISSLEHDRHLLQIHVYSSDTRTWKICVESFPVWKPSLRDPFYWNGAVYWTSFRTHTGFLCFKIDVEQVKLLSFEGEETLMYFGESRGHLHLVLPTNPEENSLIVLEMLTDHSAWFVKYLIQLDELQVAFPKMVHQYGWCFKVADVVRGKEEEDTFLVLSTPGKMVRYNVHDKSFKVFSSYNPNKYLYLSSFHRYIETLSSIKKTIGIVYVCLLRCLNVCVENINLNLVDDQTRRFSQVCVC